MTSTALVLARMVGTQEAPEWIAADVCAVLGIEQHHRALAGMPEDCKGRQIMTTPGGPQELLTVTEPGLYRLVARSRKPEAKQRAARLRKARAQA